MNKNNPKPRTCCRRRWPVAGTMVAIALSLLPACKSAPPDLSSRLRAGLQLLDAGQPAEAWVLLERAAADAVTPRDKTLAQALGVEARLRMGDSVGANNLIRQLRETAPTSLLTWKAAAVCELNSGRPAAARDAARGAAGLAESDGDRAWIEQFLRIVAALEAFHDGDLSGARKAIGRIDHPDLCTAASWLQQRLDLVERVLQQKVSAAARTGMIDGIADLWHVARTDPVLAGRFEAVRRELAPSLGGITLPDDSSPPRTRFFTREVAIAAMPMRALVAMAEIPCPIRKS